MPARRKGGFRHLIYFIDGTWLWPGSDKTLDIYSNVYLLNTLLKCDDEHGHAQIVHYSRGLGAVDGIRKYTAGGFAYGIDELVADLYVNVCSNYEPGDKLYLFGFSRGAVVARALTGLISRGILEAHHINWFEHVWAQFVGQGEVMVPGEPSGSRAPRAAQVDFSDKCSELNPEIEFVGVFDTVAGGHGLTEVAQRLRLAECKLPGNVKHGVHLLAIDETRSFFSPVLWTGIAVESTGAGRRSVPYLEQIWIPGVHSNVGGACRPRDLGNVALLTMIDRVVAKTSLSFDLDECRKLAIRPAAGDLVQISNEYTNRWKVFCPFPKARKVAKDIPQSLHPYAKALEQKLVHYKRGRRSSLYRLPLEMTSLPVAPEFISNKFETMRE